MNEPIQITDAQFDELVKGETPVIVDFWAPWCNPCRMLLPHLDTAAKEYEGKVIIAKMNVDENNVKASLFMIQHIPTLLFYKNGNFVARHTGSVGYPELKSLIDDFLAM